MYNILRTQKVKDRKKITDASSHNLRTRLQANIDQTKTKDNVILCNELDIDANDETSLQKKLTQYYKNLGISERKNNVLMQEFIVSASPEFFNNLDNEKIKLWAEYQLKFFKQEFKDNVKLAVLHMDEATPHIHFMLSTEEKSIKKYKNQKGEFHKETYSLNARRWNPIFLKDLHTRHAKHNELLGLKRGEMGSKSIYKPLKQYYREIEEMENELKTKIDKNKKNEEIIEKAKIMITKAKSIMEDQYNSIVDLLEILKKKELNEEEINKIKQISQKVFREENKNKSKIK